jgi:O-antigen/teichoic acid export membrane protein
VKSIIWRNVMWLAITTLSSIGSNFLYALLVARYLGPFNFGRFSLVVGIGGWLIALAQGSGTTALMVLTAQKNKTSQLFWPGIAIQLGIGIASMAISVPFTWILGHDLGMLIPAVLYAFANISFLMISVPVSIYRGLDKMEWGIAFPVSGILLVGLMILVKKWDIGFSATLAANTVSQLLVCLVVVPLAINSLGPFEWNRDVFIRLLKASAALWGVTIFQSLHWRVGIFALQMLAGSYPLGVYSAAFKLIDGLRAIPWFLLMAVLPAFARAGQSRQNELSYLVNNSVRYVLIVAFPLTICLVLLAPWIIQLIYTPSFFPAEKLLQIAALSLPAIFIHMAILNAMISMNLERPLMMLYAVSIILESMLDFVSIPIWGATGAIWGYIITECVLAALMIFFIYRKNVRVVSLKVMSAGFIGGITLLFAYRVPPMISPLFWALVLCILFYVGLIGCRVLTLQELRNLYPKKVLGANS